MEIQTTHRPPSGTHDTVGLLGRFSDVFICFHTSSWMESRWRHGAPNFRSFISEKTCRDVIAIYPETTVCGRRTPSDELRSTPRVGPIQSGHMWPLELLPPSVGCERNNPGFSRMWVSRTLIKFHPLHDILIIYYIL